MLTSELDYQLPESLIATQPAEPRDAARLMVVRRVSGKIEHFHVRDLANPAAPGVPGLLRAGDLMVFNQTRVLPALITGTRRATGGKVRGLYLGIPQGATGRTDGSASDRPVPDTSGSAALVSRPQSGPPGQWHPAVDTPVHWLVMIESRGTLREGELIDLDEKSALRLVARAGGGQWRAELLADDDTPTLLDRLGATPLPPYIRKQRRQHHEAEVRADDAQRYNTVYAHDPGSVAAPTAGLHFTPQLLENLDRLGVRGAFLTLHVGLGTFAPVRTENVEDHPIHSEHIEIPAATLDLLRQTRAAGGRIIPVGTTTVRALESLPDPLPTTDYRAETRLFVTPTAGTSGCGFVSPLSPSGLDDGERASRSLSGAGEGQSRREVPPFSFRFTDALMTNFHLPRSTLLALVAALPNVGIERLKFWYSAAIEEQYRFYSYGDAMWID